MLKIMVEITCHLCELFCYLGEVFCAIYDSPVPLAVSFFPKKNIIRFI